jgi:hypothetical protein
MRLGAVADFGINKKSIESKLERHSSCTTELFKRFKSGDIVHAERV